MNGAYVPTPRELERDDVFPAKSGARFEPAEQYANNIYCLRSDNDQAINVLFYVCSQS